MSYRFDSRIGEQLYQLLPEVYRIRDRQQDLSGEEHVDQSLARYLDAHGVLLDLLHTTIEQQLLDVSPDTCQDWLVPYFAELVAARLVSPDAEGRHMEAANAISWRQRKGTLRCAEEIAEGVGQMEVELQEAWKRVAHTPRIGMPLLPLAAVDTSYELDADLPYETARHPALPAVTVDIRYASRAVIATQDNPASKTSGFGGVRQTWRQANQHAAPCFPGSFEDVSRRTVDMRTPKEGNGLYHHKRLLMFAPPPMGFFARTPVKVDWERRLDEKYGRLIEEVKESGVTVIRNLTSAVVEIQNNVLLDANVYAIEGINFLGRLEVESGGSLSLANVEAEKVSVLNPRLDEPVITAVDCLFDELSVAGLAVLDSCTVLSTAYLTEVDAIDSIFNLIGGVQDVTGSLAYCRVPPGAPLSEDRNKLSVKGHVVNEQGLYDLVTDDPWFMPDQVGLAARAVLSPSSSPLINAGASDGGEMGYFHHGRDKRTVYMKGGVALQVPEDGGYPLLDVVFDGSVNVIGGPLTLVRSAAPDIHVATPLNTSGEVIPSLEAVDCLFTNLHVPNGLARLEYCTVMGVADCKHLQASDCIFVSGILSVSKQPPLPDLEGFMNCIRYSSIPGELFDDIVTKPDHDPVKRMLVALRLINDESEIVLGTNTVARPVFNEFLYCDAESGTSEKRPPAWGDWGYGVLASLTPFAIRFGAEDGGEMGAYHHRYYTLKSEAMLKKISEFLPVGIEPVLVEDQRLIQLPPDSD